MDNCPPRKNAPWLGLRFGSRLGLVLGLEDNQTIALEKNCPQVRVRVWVKVSFGAGGNFPRGNCPRTIYYIHFQIFLHIMTNLNMLLQQLFTCYKKLIRLDINHRTCYNKKHFCHFQLEFT